MDQRFPPLSPRLAAIAELIPQGSRVADVGSDHGALPLWLAANGRVAACLATEKTEARLARVARAMADSPWRGRLAYRAGDGLAAIHPEDGVDTIVLAGLGGRAIVRILGVSASESPAFCRLVLQPRSEAAVVRLWLSEHGWRVVAEQLTPERGRFHLTVAASRGADDDLYRDATFSREDLLAAGPLLARSRSRDAESHWRAERERLTAILSHAPRGLAAERVRVELARIERLLEAISPRA